MQLGQIHMHQILKYNEKGCPGLGFRLIKVDTDAS